MTDRKLVKGDGSKIYLIDGNELRLVSDDAILHALDPRGFDAVETISVDDPAAVSMVPHSHRQTSSAAAPRNMTVGAPLPPLHEGALWVVDDAADGEPVGYLVEGQKLRAVPDRRTLSVLARDFAFPVTASDIELLDSGFIGRPVDGFSAAARVIDVDTYVNGIAPLPYEPPGDTPVPGTDDVRIDLVDGVPMEVRRRRVRIARQVSNFIEINPISDVLWPGSAVSGASVVTGSLAPIGLHRSPGWITLTTDLTTAVPRSQSSKLESPDLVLQRQSRRVVRG